MRRCPLGSTAMASGSSAGGARWSGASRIVSTGLTDSLPFCTLTANRYACGVSRSSEIPKNSLPEPIADSPEIPPNRRPVPPAKRPPGGMSSSLTNRSPSTASGTRTKAAAALHAQKKMRAQKGIGRLTRPRRNCSRSLAVELALQPTNSGLLPSMSILRPSVLERVCGSGPAENRQTEKDTMHVLWRDLKHAIRRLRRSPGFALVVLLTLGLGIGANTAIFSLMDQVLLRPLPVRHPSELVLLDGPGAFQGRTFNNMTFSYPMYKDFRDRNEVFSGLLARFPTAMTIAGRGSPSGSTATWSAGTTSRSSACRRGRPGVQRRRRPHARRASGRGPQLRLLAAAFRRRPVGAEPDRSPSTATR